jgi:hypothetical protein
MKPQKQAHEAQEAHAPANGHPSPPSPPPEEPKASPVDLLGAQNPFKDLIERHREGEDFLRNFPEVPFSEAAHALAQMRLLNDILLEHIRRSPKLTPTLLRAVQSFQRGSHLQAARWMTLIQTYTKMGYAKRSTAGRRTAA